MTPEQQKRLESVIGSPAFVAELRNQLEAAESRAKAAERERDELRAERDRLREALEG